VRAKRDEAAVQASLSKLTDAARDDQNNLMYPILDAVNAYATLGEITGVFRQAFGEYQEPVFF
jgi:methylmalonyl-CoA mutase N-terminal domain/subunit